MEILYISSAPSPKEFLAIRAASKSNSVYGMEESGLKFHTLILDGLCANPEVSVRSLVGRAVGFRSHSGIVWKHKSEQINDQLRYEHLGLINLPVLKQLCLGINCFFSILKWEAQTRGQQRAIFVDGAYVTMLPFVIAAKKLCDCTVGTVICDIHKYMADVKDSREDQRLGLVHRMMRGLSRWCYGSIDRFVLLTEAMNDVINPGGKPYIVMEGLVDRNMETVSNNLEDKVEESVVMYAGALREQFGLKNLVEGFMAYQNPRARLWIFGGGDYAGEIEKAATQDFRILFGGRISQKEVVEKERIATLLVNPRPVGQEFTKYSFPSKNMEYMASGTPILTTRLPGIPSEYYDFIYTIDGDTAEDVTKSLETVLSRSKEELHEKGKLAHSFVLQRKNNVIQSERILNLLKES